MPQRRRDAGYVLVTALVALAVMSLLAAAALRQATSSLRTADQAVRAEQALYLANAGVEWALASARLGTPELAHSAHVNLGDGVHGQYVVHIEPLEDRLLVRSTGTVTRGGEATSRTVEAEIALSGGGGPPAESEPLILRQAARAGGQVLISNHVSICGDILTTGEVQVQNNSTVWGRTHAEDRSSPCKSVVGTGMAVSSSQVHVGNNGTIQGGWCEDGNPGPCGTLPPEAELRPPGIDLAALKARATEWWVRTPSECAGRPEGALCKVLPSRRLSLQESMTFAEPALIYVDANLVLEGNARVDVYGPVTFVVEGEVSIEGNAELTCGGSDYCPVALIATQDVVVKGNAEVHALIHTDGQYTGQNNAALYGNVMAPVIRLSNNYVQHSFPAGAGAYPPGLIQESGGYTGDPPPVDPHTGFYARWK